MPFSGVLGHELLPQLNVDWDSGVPLVNLPKVNGHSWGGDTLGRDLTSFHSLDKKSGDFLCDYQRPFDHQRHSDLFDFAGNLTAARGHSQLSRGASFLGLASPATLQIHRPGSGSFIAGQGIQAALHPHSHRRTSFSGPPPGGQQPAPTGQPPPGGQQPQQQQPQQQQQQPPPNGQQQNQNQQQPPAGGDQNQQQNQNQQQGEGKGDEKKKEGDKDKEKEEEGGSKAGIIAGVGTPVLLGGGVAVYWFCCRSDPVAEDDESCIEDSDGSH